jgi:hypothetical protein
VPDLPECAHHQGFSESQEETFCRMFYIERRIGFAVFECSMYSDKRHASKAEMEEIHCNR